MFEIKVSPQEVDAFVKDALMKSMLGERLTGAVNSALKEAMEGYNSPVKKLCQEALMAQIRAMLEAPEAKAKIQQAIAVHFTDETLNRIIQGSVDNALKAIKNDSY